MSHIVPFRFPAERASSIRGIAAHLRAGGLIAYPTETVYGFGGLLLPTALAGLARLKSREPSKPFLLLVGGPDVDGLDWTPTARALAAAFWPGPLTLALQAVPGAFPAGVVGPTGAVAVRHSPHPAVRAIVEAVRAPITSTSANTPGRPPASTANEVADVLRSLGAVDRVLLLDAGRLPPSAPSTIVECIHPTPRLLRAGAIDVESLRKVVGGIEE